MVIQTICDTCGMEYDWAGVTVGGQVFCCAGCAAGGPCTCAGAVPTTVVTNVPGRVVVTDGAVVVGDGAVVVPGETTVIER